MSGPDHLDPSPDNGCCVRIVAGRFHAEREQVRPVMTANFGSAWADNYVSKFLFAYGGGKR